jgi:hypothetical protein
MHRLPLSPILGLILLALTTSSSLSATDGPASKALRDGQRYAAEGQYQKALDVYIWYHDNALTYEPAHHGVRLSFALSYWQQLAGNYPPARTALVEIRDKKQKWVAQGELDWDLFADVAAINQTLGEPGQTVALFETLDRDHPDFAKRVFPVAEETIIAAKKTSLTAKYLGDPKKQLRQAIENRNDMIAMSEKRGFDSSTRTAADRIFTMKATTLVNALVDLDKIDQAREIAAEARKVVDDPAISERLPK